MNEATAERPAKRELQPFWAALPWILVAVAVVAGAVVATWQGTKCQPCPPGTLPVGSAAQAGVDCSAEGSGDALICTGRGTCQTVCQQIQCRDGQNLAFDGADGSFSCVAPASQPLVSTCPTASCIVSDGIMNPCPDATSATCGADPCAGVSCSERGTCIEQPAAALCQCVDGFSPQGLECLDDREMVRAPLRPDRRNMRAAETVATYVGGLADQAALGFEGWCGRYEGRFDDEVAGLLLEIGLEDEISCGDFHGEVQSSPRLPSLADEYHRHARIKATTSFEIQAAADYKLETVVHVLRSSLFYAAQAASYPQRFIDYRHSVVRDLSRARRHLESRDADESWGALCDAREAIRRIRPDVPTLAGCPTDMLSVAQIACGGRR